MLARVSPPLGFDYLKGRRVSIYAGKWLALVLTSYASSVTDVANSRFQTMNVWTVSPDDEVWIKDPTFIVPRAGRQRQ
jgi:hypothetical protein